MSLNVLARGDQPMPGTHVAMCPMVSAYSKPSDCLGRQSWGSLRDRPSLQGGGPEPREGMSFQGQQKKLNPDFLTSQGRGGGGRAGLVSAASHLCHLLHLEAPLTCSWNLRTRTELKR